MAVRKNKPLVDLANGGTIQDVVVAAQGRSLRIELITGMQMVRENKTNSLKSVCQAYLYTTRVTPSGSRTSVPLCMPLVGDSWAEVLTPLAILLDDEKWSDIQRVGGN